MPCIMAITALDLPPGIFSESYPELVYRLEYTENVNGEFYIGRYDEKNSYKIIEIDNTLHESLLSLLDE